MSDEMKSATVGVEAVRDALRKAFRFGETHWQQADSEHTSQHRKADETMATFKAWADETAAALAQQPTSVDWAWKPISEAPTGKLCIVGWQVVEAGEYPDRHEFDYIEDGRWVHHDENVDHAAAVAPSGSKLPSAEPPYQWFIEVPDFPALASQKERQP